MITGGKEQKGKRTLVSSIIRFWAVKKKPLNSPVVPVKRPGVAFFSFSRELSLKKSLRLL